MLVTAKPRRSSSCVKVPWPAPAFRICVPGLAAQEQVEQQPLAERVPRADEVRRAAPVVAHEAKVLEQRSPAPAEHVLARVLAVGGEPARREPLRELGGPRPAGARRAASASASPGGTSSALSPSREELARGRRVGGDERRAARERLEGLVRDHPRGLAGGAEDPERAAGAVELGREAVVLDPRDVLDVRRRVAKQRRRAGPSRRGGTGHRARGVPRRGSSRARGAGSACRRRGRVNRSRRAPAGREQALLGADEADGEAVARGARSRAARWSACASVSATTRSAERNAWRSIAASARAGGGAGTEAAAVVDERVGERDERVEDDGPPARGAPRGREVEVARVADDHGVGALGRACSEQPRLGGSEPERGRRPGRPAVAPALPDADVPLGDLDARAPEARDHLRVPRVVALVGAEVENPHPEGRPTRSSTPPPGHPLTHHPLSSLIRKL